MNSKRIAEILKNYPDLHILVAGDYFLDQYLMIDRDLAEISLETGLECHQVTEIRNSPGAAGTVANNLVALDVSVNALSTIGKDGRGFDLKTELLKRNVDIRALIESSRIMTPTYTKPMVQGKNEPLHELERIDIKNRSHLPIEIEDKIIENLEISFQLADGIVLVDQVQEENCGVLTDRVRNQIASLALKYPDKPVLVDSRLRSAAFKNVTVKCNLSEALNVTGESNVEQAARKMVASGARSAFITMGEKGIFAYSNGKGVTVPAVRVDGPIDICGAGDSAAAGILSALCAGASFEEAAIIGNLTASITIQQIGTTGTASREGIIQRAFEFFGE